MRPCHPSGPLPPPAALLGDRPILWRRPCLAASRSVRQGPQLRVDCRIDQSGGRRPRVHIRRGVIHGSRRRGSAFEQHGHGNCCPSRCRSRGAVLSRAMPTSRRRDVDRRWPAGQDASLLSRWPPKWLMPRRNRNSRCGFRSVTPPGLLAARHAAPTTSRSPRRATSSERLSGVPSRFLRELHPGGQAQLGVDVREVRLHRAW